jgi:signal transduction histidine kinase
VGSALTQLTLLGSPSPDDPPEPGPAGTRLGQINELAREIVGKLDELVWAVNPRHDTTTGLVDYLCHHAETALRGALRVRYDIAPGLSHLPVPADRRHQLFLAFKAALDNVLRHAAATEVWLRVRVESAVLRVVVEDNGHGFDPGRVPATSDGLANLRHRLGSVGGSCTIESADGRGTRVEFRLPLSSDG